MRINRKRQKGIYTYTFFLINDLFLTLAPKIVKNGPKKLFRNCLVDALLDSIVLIFNHSQRRHNLLQRHLEYVMHPFDLFSQWIV